VRAEHRAPIPRATSTGARRCRHGSGRAAGSAPGRFTSRAASPRRATVRPPGAPVVPDDLERAAVHAQEVVVTWRFRRAASSSPAFMRTSARNLPLALGEPDAASSRFLARLPRPGLLRPFRSSGTAPRSGCCRGLSAFWPPARAWLRRPACCSRPPSHDLVPRRFEIGLSTSARAPLVTLTSPTA